MNQPLPRFKYITHAIKADDRIFPLMRIEVPAELRLDELLNESLLGESGTISPIPDQEVGVSIRVRFIDTPDRSVPDGLQMPAFKKYYRSPNPGVIYDHAAIRFNPLGGSTLYLSRSIPLRSNYFYNIGRTPIVHAAAVQGSGLLHSAHIQYNGNGILMPGAAFSGKSSLALFATLAGAKLISDDLVLLGIGKDRQFCARAFRSGLLMRKRTHNLLPSNVRQHGKAVEMGDITKYAYSRRDLNESMQIDAPVNLILFPSISSERIVGAVSGYKISTVAKNTAMTALLNSLESTVLMPGLDAERQRVTKTIVRLVSSKPCVNLTMDESFLDDPVENCSSLLQDLSSIIIDQMTQSSQLGQSG